MALFIFQITFITTLAVAAGVLLGWWAQTYHQKDKLRVLENELSLVKNYFTDSIKESSQAKLKLKLAEEKIDLLSRSKKPEIEGVDFEAYQLFENTVKEAQMRKYLN